MKIILFVKNKLMLSACLFLTGGSLLAQTGYQWKTSSSGGYTYKYVTNDPSKTRFYTLKNGLTVVLSQNSKEPIIGFRVAVRAGSNTDPKNATGLAHYLEHLMFKGTDKFGTLNYDKEKPLLDKIEALYEQYRETTEPLKRKEIYAEIDKVSKQASNYSIAGEYDQIIKSIGGTHTNAHTWYEETVFKEDFPSNVVDQFLALQAERFRNPIFRLFHTELETVYEEKNENLDNDFRKKTEQTLAKLFPTHNYGQQTTIGTIQHLKSPSLVEIRKYYDRYYVPNNMLLTFAGDFNPDEMIKKIDHSFAYMKPKALEQYNPLPEKPLTEIQKIDIYGPSTESINISYRGYAESTGQSLFLTLISDILSNGNAGLIDINLNQGQKTQRADASYLQMKDYGVFSLSASPKQGQTLEEVQQLLLEQVAVLKKGKFDESLIQAAVANRKFRVLRSLDVNSARLQAITDEFIRNRGENWDKRLNSLDVMSKITKNQIIVFANQFFKNNYVVAYKRKGEDRTNTKVEKPIITPVNTNASETSAFAKKLLSVSNEPILPQFLDYKKDLNFGKAGVADVITVQNKDNSIFTLTYKFDFGTWSSPLLPYAAQYLTFLNTDKYSAEEINRQFYNIACNYSFNAENETSTIRISGLQENFDRAVTLVEHIFANCKPDEQALSELKKGIIKARANDKLDKETILEGLNAYAQYGADNPFNYSLDNEAVEGISSAQLVSIIQNLSNYKHVIIYYGPKTLVDFTTDISKLHALPKEFISEPLAKRFSYSDTKTNQVFFADYDMVQSKVSWLRNSGIYDPKLTAKVTLFNSYFGKGMSSVVFQTIRESKALAYSASAVYALPDKKDKKYAMLASIGSQVDKMNEAVKSMNELLNRLPVEDRSFEISKSNALNAIETERITKEDIISAYFSDKKLGYDHDSRIDTYTGLKAVTFEDIKKFHEQNIANKPYAYCIMASEKKVKMEDLEKFGPVNKLNLEQLFGY